LAVKLIKFKKKERFLIKKMIAKMERRVRVMLAMAIMKRRIDKEM